MRNCRAIFFVFFLFMPVVHAMEQSEAENTQKNQEKFNWSGLPREIQWWIWEYVGFKIPTALALIQKFNYGDLVNAVACSAEGRTIVAGGGCGVKVWNRDSNELVCELYHESIVHGSSVNAVACSAKGRTIVSGGWYGVKVWNRDSNELVCEFDHESIVHGSSVNAVACSAKGRTIVSGGGYGVKVWNRDSNEPVRELYHESIVYGSSVNAVACSAKGGQ